VEDERPVLADSVLGVVVCSIDYVGAFLLSLRSPRNIALCLGIILVIFLAPELYRRLTRGRQTDEEEDAAGQAACAADAWHAGNAGGVDRQ
jgi:hypothetical protein